MAVASARSLLAASLPALALACASPRPPSPAPAPTPVADAPAALPEAPPPPPPPPTFTLGDQAAGASVFARSTATDLVRGALPLTGPAGLEGALAVFVERANGATHDWRVFLARPDTPTWLNPEGVYLLGEPVEVALHTVDPAQGPLLFVRYSDPREVPSVRVFGLRAADPWVTSERTGGVSLDGVRTLAEVPSRFPAANNLTPEALAARTALAVAGALAEAPDAQVLPLLAPDLRWCTASEGQNPEPQRCRVVRAPQRTPAWVRDTLRRELRRFADSEMFEQGPDFAEGSTGNDHRTRLTFSAAGPQRRLLRVDATQIDHGE